MTAWRTEESIRNRKAAKQNRWRKAAKARATMSPAEHIAEIERLTREAHQRCVEAGLSTEGLGRNWTREEPQSAPHDGPAFKPTEEVVQ